MVGIYKIQNKINGKIYIGQAMDIEERWKQHKRDSKKKCKQAIHKAIAKYGADNFDFSVVEECSADELDEREIYWIKELDTFNTNTGYNCTLGGGGNNQGKDSYSKEYIRAKSKKRYYKVKDDPEFKENDREKAKAFRDAHKDDPEYKMKSRVSKKKYYDKVKNDTEFKSKHSASSLAYYYSHRFNPTPDHTEMPLF